MSWKLKTLDYDARFIKLAGEINTQMPMHVVRLISSSLNENQKSLNGSKILIIGVAYKNDIDDCRESPAIDIIELLENSRAKITYYDPYVPILNFNLKSLKSLSSLDEKILSDFDACAILTNHTNIDYDLIEKHSNLIIDTRNVFQSSNSEHIRRLEKAKSFYNNPTQ